nr:MAG TPA: SAGA-associated factor 11-FINGER, DEUBIQUITINATION, TRANSCRIPTION FACTOR, SAGA [Caudoviricetes sp.]
MGSFVYEVTAIHLEKCMQRRDHKYHLLSGLIIA